jgi:hypothetical protein
MSRSPLAYPLNRGADMDVGGAADLQTDVMRFMAIISLCLVAIFALVQSMPIAPPAAPQIPVTTKAIVEPADSPATQAAPAVMEKTPEATTKNAATTITLTRPKWTPKLQPKVVAVSQPPAPAENTASAATIETVAEPVDTSADEPDGFTLRFESDAVLTRLVAGSRVGVYAIEPERARRMTVSDSQISFWDASVPNSFHEMELSTVPVAVVDALGRTGIDTATVSWGVTLPGKLKTQLEQLMQNHSGGSLVIAADGEIRLEDS